MKAQILERLNDLKSKSGKSYEDVHDTLGYAASTVHRWHRGESNPDMDQLTALVEFYGGEMRDLYADVGKQEMTATQDIGYQGAVAMVEHYEARLKAKDDQQMMLQDHHRQAIEHRDKVVAYLKEQVEAMQKERKENREELDKQRNRADELDRKRHNVFWGMLVIIIMLLVMMGVMIGVDAPGIGMGWR